MTQWKPPYHGATEDFSVSDQTAFTLQQDTYPKQPTAVFHLLKPWNKCFMWWVIDLVGAAFIWLEIFFNYTNATIYQLSNLLFI